MFRKKPEDWDGQLELVDVPWNGRQITFAITVILLIASGAILLISF